MGGGVRERGVSDSEISESEVSEGDGSCLGDWVVSLVVLPRLYRFVNCLP